MKSQLTTLCHIERVNDQGIPEYLMMHRVKKEKDINKDKWIGVGGHFEWNESPEDCLLREVKEETGLTLTSYQFRGIVTFIYGDICEYMHLYSADAWEGSLEAEESAESQESAPASQSQAAPFLVDCNEGILEWLPQSSVYDLDIWEGDKIFFRLLEEKHPFFSLKLVYDTDGNLQQAALDGKPVTWDAQGNVH